MADQEESQNRNKIPMNHEEAEAQGLIGILWDTKGRYMHHIGWRYRRARASEVHGGKVANYVTPEGLEKDKDRLQASLKYEKGQLEKIKKGRGH